MAFNGQLVIGFKERANAKFNGLSLCIVVANSFALVFLLTTLMGVWAAYDRLAALERFAWITTGVLVLFIAPRLSNVDIEVFLAIFGSSCTFVALGLGLYFLLQSNWQPVNVTAYVPFHNATLLLHRLDLTLLLPKSRQDNLIASCLIVLIPLGAGAALWTWIYGKRWFAVVKIGALAFALFVLLLTLSRGALLGLMVGGLVAIYYAWRIHQKRIVWYARLIGVALSLLVILGLAVYLAVIIFPGTDARLGISAMGGSAGSRIQLWRETLPLIQDYWFTGSGLASTTMVYSTYVFLLHVPFLQHAHNLYLQIAVEQGIPGLIAFLGITSAALGGLMLILVKDWVHGAASIFVVATTASCIALLIHGLFDAELYVSVLAFMIFVPFASALVIQSRLCEEWKIFNSESSASWHSQIIYLLSGLIVLLALAVTFVPGRSGADFEANLGAVAQSKAELSIFHWPEWPVQDAVRRNGVADLSAAIAYYSYALAVDPNNVTANRRLGQIALSQGDFQAAIRYLAAAYRIAPNQRATRQLLGEAYALTGDANQAVALWNTIDVDQGQLQLREWWYSNVGPTEALDRLNYAIALLAKR